MSFITKADIRHRISEDEFDTITQSTDSNIGKAIISAIGKVEAFLSARYDVAKIFKAISPFTIGGSFDKDDIVLLDEAAYVDATIYGANAYAEFEGVVFKSIAGSNQGNQPDTNPDKWTNIHYDDTLYICLVDSTTAIDVNNLTNWKPASAHQAVRDFTIDIAIYNLHASTQPRNISQIRVDNKNDALDWLEAIRDGKGKLSGSYDLELHADTNEGQTIRFGGNTIRRRGGY